MPRFGTQLLIALSAVALLLTTSRLVYLWVETAR